jgi:hypothetical protein
MIRTIIFHHLLDLNDLPAAERWFYRYHIPEVLRSRPLSYLSYRAVPPPPGAEDYGLFNYKIHENVHAPEGETKLAHLSMTPEVVPLRVIMVNVPVAPTEDFLGSDLALDDKTILRWITVFRYPEGVSVEKGDNWYINVHAPHVMRQPGLTRFFSYRVLPSAVPVRKGASKFLHPGSEVSSNWHRVSEMWFENSNGWVESIIKSPPGYSKPVWATHDDYPFFEPGVDFVSMFILERPTDDWVREITPACL